MLACFIDLQYLILMASFVVMPKLCCFHLVVSKNMISLMLCAAEIFSDVQPLVQSALDGYNVSIFSYGQSGSGKTHTMVCDFYVHLPLTCMHLCVCVMYMFI